MIIISVVIFLINKDGTFHIVKLCFQSRPTVMWLVTLSSSRGAKWRNGSLLYVLLGFVCIPLKIFSHWSTYFAGS